MRWIRSSWIIENLVLVVRVDNCLGPFSKDLSHLRKDGLEVRIDEGEAIFLHVSIGQKYETRLTFVQRI